MFTIRSSHALAWPALKFKLKKGKNEFADALHIPGEAREKLVRFRERGVIEFDLPEAWGMKEKKPAPAPKEQKPESKPEDFDVASVEITPKSLDKLKIDQLKLVAAELEVDVSSAKNKDEIVQLLVAAAAV